MLFNASDPDDVTNWPEAAKVPLGDASENLYDPLLRGRVSASQGDVWMVSWEGNPSFTAGREHPLGIMVEQRGMGWNFPSGNEDILYFIYTFYNVTARNPEAYAAIRPGMREIAEAQGVKFQDLNETKYGIDIPDGGYSLTDLFAAFGADMDVSECRRQLRLGQRAVLAGVHLRVHLLGRRGMDLRPRHLRGAVLPRGRLRRREIPEEPGSRRGRGGADAVQQHDQRRRVR